MKLFMRGMAAAVLAVSAMAFTPQQAAAVPVDVELSLLIDISGSVDANEWALQRDGYVNAFQSATIQNLILDTDGGNRKGAIAVNYIQWSGASQQYQSVAWTLIDSVASANAFAAAIAAAPRPTPYNLTAPGSAINYAAPLFTNNGFEGDTLVIDVSGDGAQNDGANTATARNNALAGGIDRINGLAILGESGLLAWYQNNIQGGTDSFTIAAGSFADFNKAVYDKLYYEITGTNPIPLPAPVFLLLGGLFGMGVFARRKKAA
jgi:hypothetical protein